MKQLLKRISRMTAIAALGLTLFTPSLALAQSQLDQDTAQLQEGLCAGAGLSTNTSSCTETGTEADEAVNDTIAFVINLFSIIVGVIAVIMIIVGGFKYITSGGDSGNVTGAKNTILYAIIGLIIVAIAQVIVKYVLGKATTLGT